MPAFVASVGSFLLAVELFSLKVDKVLASFCTYNWSIFADSFSFTGLTIGVFLLTVGKCSQIRSLRDSSIGSLTVSKETPTVSKKPSPLFLGGGGRRPKTSENLI